MPLSDRVLSHILLGFMAACLGLLLLTAYGHNYRYPIHEQIKSWHNGVRNWGMDPTGNPHDTFDYLLYEQTRSVAEAKRYIEDQKTYATEEELLYATYDFVRARFYKAMAHLFMRSRYAPVLPCKNTSTIVGI